MLIDQLQDRLRAAIQLTGTFPKVAEASHLPKLEEAFEKLLSQTEERVELLNNIFNLSKKRPSLKPAATLGLSKR